VPLRGLEAAYFVQANLARSGFPCADVLVPPRSWPGGAAAVMTHLDAGPPDDPHTPAARRALAEAFAQFVATAASLDPALPLAETALPSGSLFPPPHNALFDLDAPGGDWIDERARAARHVLDTTPENRVGLHSDFSSANVIVSAGKISAVYDMDSIARADEMLCLARTAVHFTYRGDLPWTWPTRDESVSFVADYVAARGLPLTEVERRRLDAGAIYAMAYTARCEHGMRPAPAARAMGDALRTARDAYFR
jgi:hypothetical protein